MFHFYKFYKIHKFILGDFFQSSLQILQITDFTNLLKKIFPCRIYILNLTVFYNESTNFTDCEVRIHSNGKFRILQILQFFGQLFAC